MGAEMNTCPWEEIRGFDGWTEFERFLSWIDMQIADGTAREVPVFHAYNVMDLTEKWFEHIPSKTTWRLVWPDPPFAGVFLKVEISLSRVR